MTSKTTTQSVKPPNPSIILPKFSGNAVELQFPIWRDNEIKATDSVEIPKTKETERKSLSRMTRTSLITSQREHFRDPEMVSLPASITPNEWVFQSEIFSDAIVSLYKNTSTYSNFINGSRHLFASEFMRTFISTIQILEHLSLTMPWPIEGASVNYSPNTENERWRPWHHIYSLCEAGKGIPHAPTLNPYGKYFVRLYWMGCWRKITVDDSIPLDLSHHILLPTVEEMPVIEKISKMNSSLTPSREGAKRPAKSSIKLFKKREIELWPFLLCKAMLKIASLTWTEEEEIVDFNMISALTGWVAQKVCTLGQMPDDIWEICMSYSKNYKWPEEEQNKSEILKKEKPTKKDKSKETSKTSKSTKESKSKKKDRGIKEDTIKRHNVMPSCVVATLADLRGLSKDEIPSITPCWSHQFLIEETRNKPFTKPDPEAYDLALWKRFRWVDWAKEQGIFVETDFSHTKFVKMVAAFKLIQDAADTYSRITIDQRNVVKSAQENVKDKKENEEKKDAQGMDKFDKKKKTSKEKEDESKDIKKVIIPEPDPSIWIDFNTLSKYIDDLYIFLKPSQFSKVFKVTNMKDIENPVLGSVKVQTDEPTDNEVITIPWRNDLQNSHNEPLYIFLDNLDYSYIVVNLNQNGSKVIPSRSENDTFSIVLNEPNKIRNNNLTHILVEKYNWMNRNIGDSQVGISTFGSKSIIVRLNPGRNVLRIWIKSMNSFMVFIFCNEPIQIGNFETINEAMLTESQSLFKACYNVGDCFGKLIAAFGQAEYKKCLLDFYSSYKPDGKYKSSALHDAFFRYLLTALRERYGSNANKYLTAMRCLFVNPRCGFPPIVPRKGTLRDFEPTSIPSQYNEYSMSTFSSSFNSSVSDQIDHLKLMENSACIIQAFFKRIYVQKILSYHKPEHHKHERILETLKSLYKDMLNVQARIITFGPIFRKLFFYTEELELFKLHYKLYRDLQTVVLNQTLTGKVPVTSRGWVLICRYIFQVNSTVGEVIKICVFCNADTLFLRVFNNDTNEEINRYSYFSGVDMYMPNVNGYTVVVYGWVSNTNALKWKLCFITLNKGQNDVIAIQDKRLERYFISDIYKPNALRQICKCRVAFNTTTSATLRFSCSLETARFKLIHRDYKGSICNYILGIGNVILPVVDFAIPYSTHASTTTFGKRRRRSSDGYLNRGTSISSPKRQSFKMSTSAKSSNVPTYYNTIEAFVLDDSWPLTVHEWNQVDTVKLKKLTINPIDNSFVRSSSVSRKISDCKASLNLDSLPKPYWCIQIIAPENSLYSIFPDLRREETTRIYKDMWNMDPDRYEFAKKLRSEYLLANYVGSSPSSLNSTTDLISDPSETETKYLTRPVKPSKALPILDFAQYCNTEDSLARNMSTNIKCIEDAIQDQFDRQDFIDNFDRRVSSFENWSFEMLNSKIDRNLKSEDWFHNCKLEGDQKLAVSYKLREACIKSFTTEDESTKIKDKGKKEKKKKKK